MNTTNRSMQTALVLFCGLVCLPTWSQSATNATSDWSVTIKTVQFAELVAGQSIGPSVTAVANARLVGFSPTNLVAVILNGKALKATTYNLDTNLVVMSGSAPLPIVGVSILETDRFNPDAVPVIHLSPGQRIWGQASEGAAYYLAILVVVSERQAQDVAGRGLPLTIRGLLDVPQFEVRFKKGT